MKDVGQRTAEAAALKHAVPYIRIFKGKTFVIKAGGGALDREATLQALIEQINRHPLARALRVDKLTLAALGATLRLYQDPDTVEQKVPLRILLSTPVENLHNRADRLAPQLAACDAIVTALT